MLVRGLRSHGPTALFRPQCQPRGHLAPPERPSGCGRSSSLRPVRVCPLGRRGRPGREAARHRQVRRPVPGQAAGRAVRDRPLVPRRLDRPATPQGHRRRPRLRGAPHRPAKRRHAVVPSTLPGEPSGKPSATPNAVRVGSRHSARPRRSRRPGVFDAKSAGGADLVHCRCGHARCADAVLLPGGCRLPRHRGPFQRRCLGQAVAPARSGTRPRVRPGRAEPLLGRAYPRCSAGGP